MIPALGSASAAGYAGWLMPEPPSRTATVETRAIDRALELGLSGEREDALRIAAGSLEQNPLSALDTLVTAWLLGALGEKSECESGLAAALERALLGGNLPLAIAAYSLLESPGPALLEGMATAFAKGGSRIASKRVAPPEFVATALEPKALDAKLSGAPLLARAVEVLAAARAAQDEKSLSEAASPMAPHALFAALDAVSFKATVSALQVRFVAADEVLVEEGSVGNEAFIVARGELEVSKRSNKPGGMPLALARLGNGALFGEMALLSSAPRTATVIAVRPSIVLAGSKAALDRVAAVVPEVGRVFADFCLRRMLDNLGRTNFILKSANPVERPALIERFTVRQFNAGERIVEQGSAADGLHIIALGEVDVLHKEGAEPTLVARLGPGEVVGEVALILRRPAITDVVAHHPTVTLYLQRDKFSGLARAHPKVFVELYELAVQRDAETASAASAEATEGDDFVLV